MISVEEAQAACLDLVTPLRTEDQPLTAAFGRYMPHAAIALRDQPPFDAAQMDGYALACHPNPGDRFAVVAQIAAGKSWDGVLAQGQACRIFTGAPLPQGAVRVVIQEDVSRGGDQIVIKDGLDHAPYIRPKGHDFARGFSMSPRRLTANDLALLAAMNLPCVPVSRKPVVAIIATGDELVWPGDTPGPNQIIAASSFALKAICEAEGAEVRLLPIAADTAATLTAALRLAQGADLILTTGGASVGDHDIVTEVAESLGLERRFWKIAMRPGKPLMAGKLRDAALLALPGNPVASVVCAHLFVRPMLRKMLGLPAAQLAPQPRYATLTAPLAANGPRAHYQRATVVLQNGAAEISAFARQDSALLSVLAQANALIIQAPYAPASLVGERVAYLPL